MIDYYKELEKFKNSNNFFYILDNKDNYNDLYKKEKEKYIKNLKNIIINDILNEYYIEDIPKNIIKEFSFNQIEYPLLVIKQNNEINIINGIKDI